MINDLPSYISLVFVATTIITFALLFHALKKAQTPSLGIVILGIIVWLLVQGIISYSGFYTQNLFSLPPRFVLNVVPPLLFIIVLFNTRKGKSFIDKLNVGDLALISIVRIPVELVLYWLSVHKAIPIEMTFEGRNFDILSGISAPLVVYAFQKKMIGRKTLLIWNLAALVLLLIIVTQAVLALPSPFQQISLHQPNVGVLYFPFNWLPAFIVPVVFFCHFASIRMLLKPHE